MTRREAFLYSTAGLALVTSCWFLYIGTYAGDVLEALNAYANAIVFVNVATMLMILGYMVGREAQP